MYYVHTHTLQHVHYIATHGRSKVKCTRGEVSCRYCEDMVALREGGGRISSYLVRMCVISKINHTLQSKIKAVIGTLT